MAAVGIVMPSRYDAGMPEPYYLNIVVPVFNEEECLKDSAARLFSVLDGMACKYKIIFVNDGSSDGSLNILQALKQQHSDVVLIVDLSRNFGQQIAITAGIDHADGDAIVIIDADMQDPPEIIPELVKKWQEGYDVVHARRNKRLGENHFKTWTAYLFYRLLSAISDVPLPIDVGDFRLISRRAASDLRNLRERTRYVRGLVCWIGYKQAFVDYMREERKSGHSKYGLAQMLRFSIHGIASFSLLPLRLASWCGCLAALGAALYIVYAIYGKFVLHNTIQGWTSVILAVLLVGGLQLICLGIIGEYIGMLCVEAKKRPLYLVNQVL